MENNVEAAISIHLLINPQIDILQGKIVVLTTIYVGFVCIISSQCFV